MKRNTKKISFIIAMVLIIGLLSPLNGMNNVFAETPAAVPANPAIGMFAPYTDRVPTDGLAAHYKFEDNLSDSSGNNNNGTAVNGEIKYINGALGKSAVFDGKSYIEVAASDSLNLTKDFTISVWLYKDVWDKNDYSPVLTKGNSSERSEKTPFALLHNYGGLKPCLELYNAKSYGTLQCETEVSKQKWHMVSVTFNGNEARFYIDGVFKNKASWEYGELSGSDQKLLIGFYPMLDTWIYTGAIDELRLYNRLLSDAEIKCLYDDVMATKDTAGKLVAYYKFDNDVKDYSGFGNHGNVAAGQISFAKGIYGNGAKFDGTNYIEVPDSDSLDVNKAFTISAWLFKDGAGVNGYAPVVTKGEDEQPSVRTPFAFFHSSDGINMDLRMDNNKSYGSAECKTGTPMKKWYYATVTFNSTEIKFYIDGVFKSKSTWEYGELFHSNQKLMIGYYPYGNELFTGIIDDLRIYNYTLTDQQVKFDYEMTKNANNLWSTHKLAVSPNTNGTVSMKLGTAVNFDVLAVNSKNVSVKANEYAQVVSSNPEIVRYERGKLIPVAAGAAELTVTGGKNVVKIKVTVQ